MSASQPRKLVFYMTGLLLVQQQLASAHQDPSSSTNHQVSSLANGQGGNSWMPSLPIGHIGVPLNGTLASALLALQPRQSSSTSTSYSRIFRPNNSDTSISQQQLATSSTTSSPISASAATGNGAPTTSTSAPAADQQRSSRFQSGGGTSNDIDTSGSNINEMVALSSLQNVRHNKLTAAQHPGHGIVDMASSSSSSNNNNEPGSREEPEASEEEESVAEEEPQQEQRFGRAGKTSPVQQLASANMMRSPVMRHRVPVVERRQQLEPQMMVQQRREPASGRGRAPDEQQKYEQDEAAGRREQEAAEASEADLINKSALDEQRQQQREIIAAQAASDARAIKEQQELLLKQQLLQQQMISRRHQEIEAERNMVGRRQDQPRLPHHQHQQQQQEHQQQQQKSPHQQEEHDEDEQGELPVPQAPVKAAPRQRPTARLYQIPQQQQERRSYQPHRGQHLLEEASRQLETAHVSDNQFSDQLDMSQSASFKDEVYDFSVERKAAPAEKPASAPPTSGSATTTKQVAPQQPAQDLQPEAQRSFQTTAQDTLTGQHKDYFQFAESYKKGQFHSGYKRGGNKLQVSGHASQHVNQAEGHNKWNAPKGRGSSYWELKHGKKQRSKAVADEAAPEEANKEHY